ncbi:MAG: DUF1566 domain-containing protein [Desulfocapsa sp.]|nr:DUF1566 domain-containing protein [Desulfocapsa sp.]
MKNLWKSIWLSGLFVCLFSLSGAVAETSQGNRFVASEDNTVLDTTTGLMWATKDNGIDIDWDAAKSYCENYSAGGHADWRLPTLKELGTIYDSTSQKQFKSVAPITLSACCPWSSDVQRKRARTIFFMSGEVNKFPKKLSSGFRALPVRKAQ